MWIYAFLLQKGPKLDLGTFLEKLLDIFGGTRKVIFSVCTAYGIKSESLVLKKIHLNND